ncbi:MAG TPA: DUF4149 domain-containing protein [Alphaproteobacteria bacterium]|nr:DUF4149 domain-containing protein [Alphaproteobacteria bacterium]
MQLLYLLSVWLHILVAAIWVGGMVFLSLVLVPVVRRAEYRGMAASLIRYTGVRFRWVGWACLGVLLVTGPFNLAYRGMTWEDVWSGRLWHGSYGGVLGVKLLLVSLILCLSGLHDFVLGPRASALWQSDPMEPEAGRVRRQAGWIGRLNLILGLGAMACGVMLGRGVP